jgi:hypothetical protein
MTDTTERQHDYTQIPVPTGPVGTDRALMVWYMPTGDKKDRHGPGELVKDRETLERHEAAARRQGQKGTADAIRAYLEDEAVVRDLRRHG